MGRFDDLRRKLKQVLGKTQPIVAIDEGDPSMVVTGDLTDFVTPTTATIKLGDDMVITVEDFCDVRRVHAVVRLLQAALEQ